MIRINLLGQPRPKARRAAVPVGLGLPVTLLVVALVAAGGWVWFDYGRIKSEIAKEQGRIDRLRADKARLEGVKREVEAYERQKPLLEHKRAVIAELDRNRTGGEELLDAVAKTVTKTDQLWLTSLARKGNSLTIEGTAVSMKTVANYITELKRSGYFDKIEIKESRQDERHPAVQTFLFSLTADFVLPQGKGPATATPGKS